MGAITSAICRSFVQEIISKFDQPNWERVDVFAPTGKDIYAKNDDKTCKVSAKDRLKMCRENGIGLFFARAEVLRPVADASIEAEKATLINAAVAERLKSYRNYIQDPVTQNAMGIYSQYGVKDQFLGHIFESVYFHADIAGKRAIIDRLKPFNGQLESLSYKYERGVLKIQRAIAALTPQHFNNDMKLLCAAGTGGILQLIGPQLQPLIGRFFVETVAPQAQSLLNKYGSVMIINLSEKTCQVASVIIARVVNSQVYYWLYCSGFIYTTGLGLLVMVVAPPLIGRAISFVGAVRDPASALIMPVGFFIYDSYFSPASRVQTSIIEQLENHPDRAEAEELIEGGIKAYQIWMHLMVEGPRKGLFQS